MIVFPELLESSLLAENSGNVELGEVFGHVSQRNYYSLGVLDQKSDESWHDA